MDHHLASPAPKPFRLVAPLVFWLLLIFALSAYPKAIIPQSKYFSWDKLAHLVEYGVLGFLTARANFYSGRNWLRTHYLWITLLFGFLFAASDEWHQHFVKGRYASVYDVIADSLGVLLSLWLFSYTLRKSKS